MSGTVTIVQIGYCRYAVRKAADAAAIVRLMAEAVLVRTKVHGERVVYFPDRRNTGDGKVGMEVLQADDFLSYDPTDPEAAANEVLRTHRPIRRGLRLTGPSIKTPPPTE